MSISFSLISKCDQPTYAETAPRIQYRRNEARDATSTRRGTTLSFSIPLRAGYTALLKAHASLLDGSIAPACLNCGEESHTGLLDAPETGIFGEPSIQCSITGLQKNRRHDTKINVIIVHMSDLWEPLPLLTLWKNASPIPNQFNRFFLEIGGFHFEAHANLRITE